MAASSCMLVAQILCFVQLSLAAMYKVVDVNGKWGTSNYFQEGDVLSFSHSTHGADVHEVSSWKEYKACQTSKPLSTLKHEFPALRRGRKLRSAAVFYFISADRSMCKSGRRVMVVVHAGSPAATPSASMATPPVAVVSPTSTATPAMAPTTSESPTMPGPTLPPPAMAPEPSASPNVISSSPVAGPAALTSGPAAAASPPPPPPPLAPSSPPSAPSSAVSVICSVILPSFGPLLA